MTSVGEQSSAQAPLAPPSPSTYSAVKRKYADLQMDDANVHTQSPPSPTAAEVDMPHAGPSFSSRDAHKAYIAKTAPHILGRTPTPGSSPSAHSSPASDDDEGGPSSSRIHSPAPTPDHTQSPAPSSNTQSHHTVPPSYRGPELRHNDPEDVAPAPTLLPTPGSATLFSITNFALNRNGWRYTAAGPCSQHLPKTVFKTLETAPAGIHWCWADRSPFTKYSADASIVSSDKGFRSARTNVGVRSGEYYAEIEILPPEQLVSGVGAPGPLPTPMRDGPHVRLGWARREAQINAPIGSDGYSYGYRDKTGDKVTLSRPLPYGKPFKAGDVVGLYIKLPPLREPEDENDPANIRRERIPIRYRSQLLFESLEYPRNREMDQLMERSRKGNSIEDALTGLDGTGIFEPIDTTTSESVSAANGLANSEGNGGSTSKVKNRKTMGIKEKPSGPPKPSLRPVPRLEGSKIGFFVNGEPQGIAFRDLFDYRPLRVKGFKHLASKVSTTKAKSSSDSKKSDANTPTINVKTRENVFDDGTLGYYPFVSMFGGARARLITDESDFRFCPPDDIEAALEAAKLNEAGAESLPDVADTVGDQRRWRPLSARFDEHLAEMWHHDMVDEARAIAFAVTEDHEKDRRNQAAKDRRAARKSKPVTQSSEMESDSNTLHVTLDDRENKEAQTHGEDDVETEGTPASSPPATNLAASDLQASSHKFSETGYAPPSFQDHTEYHTPPQDYSREHSSPRYDDAEDMDVDDQDVQTEVHERSPDILRPHVRVEIPADLSPSRNRERAQSQAQIVISMGDSNMNDARSD